MSGPFRIAVVNPVYDPALDTPDALLGRYTTLTGWSRAVAEAGASVEVVQRFTVDVALARDGVHFRFVRDGHAPFPSASQRLRLVAGAVAEAQPDVVHVNGLMFPGLLRALRAALGSATPIVVQDHAGGGVPAGWGRAWWRRRRLRRGLAVVDACSFTALGQADDLREAGVLGDQRILAIPEASTSMTSPPRHEARRRTSLLGAPLVLWVGRLNANKDPLTVLAGLDRAFGALPTARAAMVFAGDESLRPAVERTIGASPTLRDRIVLVGHVGREEMPYYFAAADLFISGSRREGSGYALIEAMACGAWPVVTDIPPFQALTGQVGDRWTPGEAGACAAAVVRAAGRDLAAGRLRVRAEFDRRLSWRAIAARTVACYQDLAASRPPGRGR
ncbi:MAG: glycosyltransferase family 4 protein [Acidobacteriota bacterium]